MTDATGARGDTADEASEIPAKYLPPVQYADLPEVLPMKKVIGPSVLLLAGAIGSGEYVLWPNITAQVGLALVWLTVLGVLTQYFLNMEIERYTLATGETAVTGFTRLWKPWGVLFIVMAVGAWMWPGWASGGTTTLSFALGFSEDAIPYVTIGVLVLIGLILTISPVVYRTVEKIQFFLVALIVLFVLYAIFFLLGGDGYEALGRGFVEVDKIPDAISDIGAAPLLGAIAFAGAGGVMNLVQSNWVRDKGLGMGARMPRVVSPFTGEESAAPTTGYFFRRDEENMRRWNEWWKVANREQFVTFFVIGAVALLTFMTLTYVTIGLTGEESFDFIKVEGEALKALEGDWLGTAFWLIGSVVLFSTNLTVLDMVARLTADVLKTGALRESATWSESRLYFATVWLMILFGSIILLSGVDQPLVLLVIASALNGVVMFVYSVLLIQLNRGVLPREIGLRGGRFAVLIWAVLFYGGFSVVLLIDQAKQLFG
ncbi:Nramp family divalent metal transporter [Nocardioides sp. YIM 152315]|uniref:Nramp family divalent metal transporter n=1 Tax=Nocardioides sp. YIM 152315 TaxID=3031760 RepID=UPI0023DB908A|nr:Nramp family divalent metal transporter [Nocardioides sp. YIM 152315]MDF1603429.1 Nramp family divalent metal transporter [Nocardioides sp. YIM 152315]